MKENKVSPWEGELAWKDEPRTGTSKNGKAWSSIDFALAFNDKQGNEQHIVFNVFGNEKVNTIVATDIGTVIRVDWRPIAREYNGKWYGKNDVIDITVFAEDRSSKEDDMPADDELGF